MMYFILISTTILLLVANQYQKQLIRKLREELTIDPLTGAKNRRYFDSIDHLEGASMILVDIDHFKSINDNYGHDVGDKVLIDVVKVLKDSIRRTDRVIRVGGEEFCILLPDCSNFDVAQISERVRKNVEQFNFSSAGVDRPITISAGRITVNALPEKERHLQTVYEKVDKALYFSKEGGRNRVTEFSA